MTSYSFYMAIIAGYQQIKRPVKYLYEHSRVKIYGRRALSYFANGESEYTSQILQQYLQQQAIYTNITYVIRPDRPRSQVELARQSVYNHVYLTAHDGEKKIIIDPSYKQFLFWGVGKTSKWTSPYTEYLFNLPPVFIGTIAELQDLQRDLRKRRQNDPEHRDEEQYYLDDWYVL